MFVIGVFGNKGHEFSKLSHGLEHNVPLAKSLCPFDEIPIRPNSSVVSVL